jgi:hypothetical protein
MNTPHLFQVSELAQQTNEVRQCHPEAGWIPVRPLGFQGLCLKRRLKLAWGVFTGQYDAVYWEPNLKELFKTTKVEIQPDPKAQAKHARDQMGVSVEAGSLTSPRQELIAALNSPMVLSKSRRFNAELLYYKKRLLEEERLAAERDAHRY